MAITLRATKGSSLTHSELDGNFTDLDGRTTTMEGGAASIGDIYVADGAGGGAYGGTSYASIYSSHADSVTVGTIGTTAKKVTGFSQNGPSNNATSDAANDKITILTKGDYWIDVTISFGTVASGDSGLYQFHVRVKDIESVIGFHRNMSGTSDKGREYLPAK